MDNSVVTLEDFYHIMAILEDYKVNKNKIIFIDKIRNKTSIYIREKVPHNCRVLKWDEFTATASSPTFLTLEKMGFDVLPGQTKEFQIKTTNQQVLEPFQIVEEQAAPVLTVKRSTDVKVEFPEYEDISPPQITSSPVQPTRVFTNSEIIGLITTLVKSNDYRGIEQQIKLLPELV